MRARALVCLLAAFAVPTTLSAGGGSTDLLVRSYLRDHGASAEAAAHAGIPSFSRQTGLACSACHTIFPELTPFGRLFKLNGYTMTLLQTVDNGGDSAGRQSLRLNLIPPVSAMIMTSWTATKRSSPATANGNVMFPQELSVFVGEAITPHIGTFMQLTYEPAEGSIAIDNADIRYSSHANLASRPLIFGFTLNNNPTVQDVWNSVPAWGYPFASSAVAPTAAAATLIDGGLGQQVAGLGAYGFWNSMLYGELSLYRSAQQGSATPPDSTSENFVKGAMPYWRLALQHQFGSHYLEVGTYGMSARLYPTGVGGLTDRYTDVALDAQYEHAASFGRFVGHATWIHERQQLDAGVVNGASANAANTLKTMRVDASWYSAEAHYGGTLAYFSTSGDADAGLYAPAPVFGSASGLPNTRGAMAELHFMPWLNTRFALQYVIYDRFNGGKNNYDGSGRNATDNNTLYAVAWMAF